MPNLTIKIFHRNGAYEATLLLLLLLLPLLLLLLLFGKVVIQVTCFLFYVFNISAVEFFFSFAVTMLAATLLPLLCQYCCLKLLYEFCVLIENTLNFFFNLKYFVNLILGVPENESKTSSSIIVIILLDSNTVQGCNWKLLTDADFLPINENIHLVKSMNNNSNGHIYRDCDIFYYITNQVIELLAMHK
uniref:Uncharacterized protein n=1 Tax=Glossina brevipalpis TaxID=37001 RepID=A0A1A9WCH6_9MUSC